MTDTAGSEPWSTEERVARLLADLRITSVMAFRFGTGPDIPVGPGSAPAADLPWPGAAALRDALATALYGAAYARVYRGPAHDPALARPTFSLDETFVGRLEARNPSRAVWEPGWRIFARDPDGTVHASKGDDAVRLPPGRYALPGPPRAAGVGDAVERWRERSSLLHQPGFYYAFGEAPPNDYDIARIARLYFDATPDAAEWLLATIPALLNRFGIPFWLKCPVDPNAFDRLDAAVLYLARRHMPAGLGLLAPLEPEFRRRLRGGTPLWTVPVFPGVGAADDPGTGESFGQSRCRLFASGLVDAWAAGRDGPEARAAAVAARFRAAGLVAAQPHLAAGLADIYAVPVPAEAAA